MNKREDKIFQNSYYHGNSLKGDTYSFDREIKPDETNLLVSTFFSTSSPEDIYPYTEIRDEIVQLSIDDEEINNIISNNKKKFNKEKINLLFGKIIKHFNKNEKLQRIKEITIIFDVISRLTGIKEYNLFDLLYYEYQEIILLELNEKIGIFSFLNTKNKLY